MTASNGEMSGGGAAAHRGGRTSGAVVGLALVLAPAGWAGIGATQRGILQLGFVQRVSIVAAAVTEEVVFRGFLMERVEELTGRPSLAVAATVVLFVGGHAVHFDLPTNAGQALLTLLFALVFLWRRDLTAPIAAHAVIDGWALLAVPALGL